MVLKKKHLDTKIKNVIKIAPMLLNEEKMLVLRFA